MIDGHDRTCLRRNIRRVDGQGLIDLVQLVAQRIELVLQRLRFLVRHIRLVIVEPVLQRLLLGFQLGDPLRLDLCRLTAFAAGALERAAHVGQLSLIPLAPFEIRTP